MANTLYILHELLKYCCKFLIIFLIFISVEQNSNLKFRFESPLVFKSFTEGVKQNNL